MVTKVLGAHRIEYGRGDPTSSEAEREALPESYVMKNGQLMGSPLSFPILCAINFVAYKTALRRYIKAKGEMVAPPSKASAVAAYWKAQAEAGMATSSHGPVVPRTTTWCTSDWDKASKPRILETTVAAIGFTLSPGKNYIAQRFLTMNSEGWRPLKGGRFEKVGYLNTGLVYAGPNGSMRPPLRMAHSEMPWAGKFGEALSGSTNKRRTLGMTFVHIPAGVHWTYLPEKSKVDWVYHVRQVSNLVARGTSNHWLIISGMSWWRGLTRPWRLASISTFWWALQESGMLAPPRSWSTLPALLQPERGRRRITCTASSSSSCVWWSAPSALVRRRAEASVA